MRKHLKLQMICFLRKIFLETIDFFIQTVNFLSSSSSDPLFSILITFYTLILLYFPRILFNLVFSPILIATALLLSTLLRLGSNQTTKHDHHEEEQEQKEEVLLLEASTTIQTLQWISSEPGCCSKSGFNESMVEWNRNVRTPLEVIHEEYEGGDDEGEGHDELKQREEIKENEALGMDELVSLSLYYPESDSGSSSDGDFSAIEGWDSPENMCFRWNQEEDDYKDGGLIEIKLDGNKRSFDFQVEEENMIEIDIGAPVGM